MKGREGESERERVRESGVLRKRDVVGLEDISDIGRAAVSKAPAY